MTRTLLGHDPGPGPLRIGLIGVGRISTTQIVPALSEARNATLFAAASRDRGRAALVGATRVHGSYEELLRDPDVDAVFIATHNGLHKELAIEAMQHGKHVLCEKPLAVTARECEEMIGVAATTGRTLVEAFMYRHHPQIAVARDLVRSGAIGEVMVVEASFRFRLTRPDDLRLRADIGGGALLDVGCYCVNASRLFLGEDVQTVRAVSVYGPTGVDLSTQAVLGFESGRHAIISCGFDSGRHQRVSIVGTEGVIHLTRPFISWTGAPQLIVERETVDEVIAFAAINTYRAEIEDFARAILESRDPLLGLDDAIGNARILDRIAASARQEVGRDVGPSP
jgi:D-xylose 1-dehydrogenase (NADP+, D-xylono-1,5-lactone-forming)